MQRMQARDFYDLWYLLTVHDMNISLYLKEFSEKCTSKDLDATEFQQKLEQRLPQYRGRWEVSLREQIKGLAEFDQVEREVMREFRKIDFY